MKNKQCSELELIHKVKNNDMSAVKELSKRYQPLYHEVTASLHINDHYAEYQQLFSSAIRQAAQRYIHGEQDTDVKGSFAAILNVVFTGIANIAKQQRS